jgi:transcriptional regulator with XRE-family HTH domain
MIPEQCRAARSWLNWTQADLAKAAGTALSTVKDYEGGRRTPIANNLAAIQAALETCGIAFVGDDGKSLGITFTKPTARRAVSRDK